MRKAAVHSDKAKPDHFAENDPSVLLEEFWKQNTAARKAYSSKSSEMDVCTLSLTLLRL